MDIADKMFAYRVKHNMSQKEFAEKCGISSQTVYSIEKRQQKPRGVTLVKLLEFIEGVATDESILHG